MEFIAKLEPIGVGKPEGLAIDWINEMIYWTDSETKRIEVAALKQNRLENEKNKSCIHIARASQFSARQVSYVKIVFCLNLICAVRSFEGLGEALFLFFGNLIYKGFAWSYYRPSCKAEQTTNGKPD